MKKIYYALPLLLFRSEIISLIVVAGLLACGLAWLLREAAKGGAFDV